MEVGQSSKIHAEVKEKCEINRNLKRNIGELAMEIKINGKRLCVRVCLHLSVNWKTKWIIKMFVLFCFHLSHSPPSDEPKSPARKEVKVAHEIHLHRELELWKQLVTDDKIRQSITK